MRRSSVLTIAAFCALAPAVVSASANVVIQNNDPAGIGFNDATPVSPVGGNNGATLGAQRLIAFQAAANKWGSTLTSSVPILVGATWVALSCNNTSAVLGSAGPAQVWRDFAGAGYSQTFYVTALANKITSTDLSNGQAQIVAQFNVNLGKPGCLPNNPFYLGLDNNHGSQVDLITVLTHELGHGLGFLTTTNGQTGAYLGANRRSAGYPSIFDHYLVDNRLNLAWTQISSSQRSASAVSVNHLVWGGVEVGLDGRQVLTSGVDGWYRPFMYAPASFAGGSSVSHWDTSATRNQLMEPAINYDLTHEVTPPYDLTYSLLRDLGW